jgi:hypothetical protein
MKSFEEQRLIFLNELKKDYPNMKVHYINQPCKESWISEKILGELSYDELLKINLRKTKKNEIIFDVEEQLKVPSIRAKLELRDWKFEQWYTGSRGVHFSVLFENLAELDFDLRNRIRKYIISEIGTDIRLATENQFLALEWAPHFKTTTEKTLFDTYNPTVSRNRIDDTIIDFCKKDLENNQIYKQELVEGDDELKDFLKDPYLHYVMNNTIKDGERDSVLFKNLAIGLVRSKQTTPESLQAIVNKIASNCPGKSVGEFNGWIEKAFKNELTEYNKAEIVAWALKYEHPVYYKLVDELQDIELATIKIIWDMLWNYRITHMDVWKELCFYNLVSTIINETEEDLRVHPIISSYSGTGKDEGMNLVKEVLDKLGIKTYKFSTVTDKTLVGGINQEQVDINTKRGVSEDEQQNGKYSWKDPRKVGILGNDDVNWVAFPEAETIFKPGVHNKSVQLILRQAMDKTRTIQKGVGGEVIDLYTKSVFSYATYPLPDAVTKILNNGLFQRAIYYDKRTTDTDHRAIVEHVNKLKFDPNTKLNFDELQYMQLLCDKLKTMKIWYNENRKQFKFFKDTHDYINYKWKTYEEGYYMMTRYDKDILNSMIRRATSNLYKLIILSSTAKMKCEISNEEVDEAFDLLSTCLDSIKELLFNMKKELKHDQAILMMLRLGSKVLGNLQREVKENLRIKSLPTINKILDKLKKLEWISEYKNGSSTCIMITEKGLNELGEFEDEDVE